MKAFNAEVLARLKGQESSAHADALLLGKGRHQDDVPLAGDDPDDRIDPDDRSRDSRAESCAYWPALPPIPPAWGFLCERAGTPVSVLLAKSALESVGCCLGIRPPQNALTLAHRCRSAGGIRELITNIYGQRGLDAAYQMAGILRPPKPSEAIPRKASMCVETADLLVNRFTSQGRVMRWFDRQEPAAPAWRSSSPPAGADDGAWCGC